MAMQFVRRISSYVRPNSSLRTRSHFSGPLSQVPEGLSKAFVIAVETSGLALCAGWLYHYDAFRCRTKVDDWKAERKVQERLKRLERGNFDSADAYLEMLDRELNALKEKLSDREIGPFDVEVYRREIAALKAKVEICAYLRKAENAMVAKTG